MQRGIVPIFGTDNPTHLRANLVAFADGMHLTQEEMVTISNSMLGETKELYGASKAQNAP